MAPQPKPRIRIVWTSEEILQLAEEAVQKYLETQNDIWRYFAEAQGVLPRNRQRKITGNNHVNAEMLEAFEIARRKRLRPTEEAVHVEVESTVEPSNSTQSLEERLSDFTLEELVTGLQGRLQGLFEMIQPITDLAAKFSAIKPLVIPKESNPTPQPRIKKPGILVLEFLPDQENNITQKISGIEDLQVELIFGGKNYRNPVPPGCLWAIFLRKVSHSLENRIRDKIGRSNVQVVDGVTGAVHAIQQINNEFIASGLG